jgi:ubiquinone/menaquinone biosynthesis C-methylase UbiE
MSHSNSWADPSKAGAHEVAQMAAFLEERSRCPDMQQVNAALCEHLAPEPGERVLEVGSGSGILCRLIAPSLQPGGGIVGVDISPHFHAEARKYAHQAGVAEVISYTTAAGERLPYAKAVFDAAFAARLLLHARDPQAVVREMARVVKPGGRVLALDWDYGSLVVDHPDRELTRRLLTWRADNHGGDNWSGRQLRRWMALAGLVRLSVHPITTVALGESENLTQSLARAAEVARQGGAITSREEQAWVGELKARIRSGTFFASIVYFLIRGIAA